jgi:hypothetical protein
MITGLAVVTICAAGIVWIYAGSGAVNGLLVIVWIDRANVTAKLITRSVLFRVSKGNSRNWWSILPGRLKISAQQDSWSEARPEP